MVNARGRVRASVTRLDKRKKAGESLSGLRVIGNQVLSNKVIIVSRAVSQDCGVYDLSAGAALPGIKRPHEIVKFLCIHPAFAFRTFHVGSPFSNIIGCFPPL